MFMSTLCLLYIYFYLWNSYENVTPNPACRWEIFKVISLECHKNRFHLIFGCAACK